MNRPDESVCVRRSRMRIHMRVISVVWHVDFDLPDQFLPEFPPAIFLTTRPELGDVSQGEVLTTQNYYRLFKDKLNPKQLDGLRLLLFPFAQQQFNLIDDRRSAEPQLGRACLDCHINDLVANGDGPIKTFTLRGIKESPPYLHDGRLLTLDDTVEFFNLVLELHLTAQEKSDLVAFLLVL